MYFVHQIPLHNPAQPRPITTLLFTDLHVETLLTTVVHSKIMDHLENLFFENFELILMKRSIKTSPHT